MKKVGIITFHRAINYGAMLQAVALQQYINELGYNSELIDYVDKLYEHYKISYNTSNVLKTIFKYIFSGSTRKRNSNFDLFLKKNAVISNKKYNFNSIKELNEDEYLAFFTGSDQTFNPIIVEHDANYLLKFIKDKYKCNAYGASIGVSHLNDFDSKWLYENIKNYNKVLVREKSGEILLNSIGINQTKLVCDPTFLLNAKKWRDMEKKVNIPKHYILYYGFKNNEFIHDKISQLSEKTRFPVYIISDGIRKNKNGYKQFKGIGPAEWLYLIDNADYIITNSFHGMIFSFIFNKQVWLGNSNDNTFSRIEDFLSTVGCSHRILTGKQYDKLEEDKEINYEIVNVKIQKYILNSKEILKSTLEDYCNGK